MLPTFFSRPPVFRVFVSSTFGDFKEERNFLQKHAFRHLRAFCESHGAHFQAIDLRWGISEEAGFDQRTMQLCIHELQRCQEITPKPNFVLLLGQRYGWRPLPASIPAEEFNEILEAIPKSDSKDILNQWYRLDTNALPHGEHVLQPRTGIFRERAIWEEEETRIATALLLGIEHVSWAADDPQREKYLQSATHQEIVEGALTVPEKVRQHIFAYFRRLEGLPSDASAAPYRDISERHPDEDSREALRSLRSAIREALPDGHTHEFTGTWTDRKVDFDLDRLSSQIEEDLKKTISQQIEEYATASTADRENSEHLSFSKNRTEFFHGRFAQLKTIDRFLSRDSPPAHRALIVHGASGAGKSALLAQAFLSARGAASESGPVVIGRFVGATPSSQNVTSLLFDLVTQLSSITKESIRPGNVIEMETAFQQQLIVAAQSVPIQIFIDAGDQLNPDGDPETLNWIPTEIPENVRLVISLLERPDEDAGVMFERARNLEGRFEFLEVGSIEPQVGESILDRLLNHRGRRLTSEQRSAVLDLFSRNRLGLFIKLLFERAVHWKSYDKPSDTYEKLAPSIPAMLDFFFDDLSRSENHGPLLVSRIFGFLAAARNGLSEDEVLSLLRADKDFSDWFRQNARHAFYEDNSQALPVILWSRFHRDCDAYITERFGDGRLVFSFYHRQVAEAAARRHLNGSLQIALADYFEAQPSWYDSNQTHPNQRRSSELPFQLERAGEWDRLATVLKDIDFIESKIATGKKFEVLFQIAAAFAQASILLESSTLIDSLIQLSVRESVTLSIAEIHATYVYRIVREGSVDPFEKTYYEAFLKRATDRDVLTTLLVDESERTRTETWIEFEINHANYYRRLGKHDKARTIGSHILPEVEAHAAEYPAFKQQLSTIQYDFGYLSYLEGDRENANKLMHKSAASADPGVYPDSFAFSKIVGAMIAYRFGRISAEEALEEHAAMEEIFQQNPNPTNFTSRCTMNVWAHRAEIHYAERKASAFSATLAALEQDRWVIQFGGAMLTRVRALNANLIGQHAEALRLYRKWREQIGQIDESPRRYLCEYGRILIDAGEKEEARDIVLEAINLPDTNGNLPWRNVCDSLLDRLDE